MSTNSAGLSDEIHAELNPAGPGPDAGPQPAPLPGRPSGGAGKEKWAAYVVALGMHPDEVGRHTRDALAALADRFGG